MTQNGLSHRKGALFAFCGLLLMHICAPTARGWGNEGHVIVNRSAARHVPQSMPGFLKRAEDELAYLGPEPDRWREKSDAALKESQEPDHFIDLERIADWTDLPPGRYEFYRRLYEERAGKSSDGDLLLPERVGLQPYITVEVFERLRVAFRQYRMLKAARRDTKPAEQAAIFYAGWLGHYVGDGSQPLHTTIRYDGWVGENPAGYTTEPGIHSRFESAFVARNIALADVSALVHAPERLADPFQNYIQYLKDSSGLVERVYALDKAKEFDGAGSPEAREFVRQRLAAGSQMLLNLWYTAWLTSAE